MEIAVAVSSLLADWPDAGAAVEVQVAEGAGGTSVRDDQAVVWIHAPSAQGTEESRDGVEPGRRWPTTSNESQIW